MATHDHGVGPTPGEQSVRRLAVVEVVTVVGFAVVGFAVELVGHTSERRDADRTYSGVSGV
jgi:hypothetical protein